MPTLVAHCGWSGAGQFLYTLSMVDVATGWVVCAGLRDKRQETVVLALQRLQAELPFRVLGLDSDNGTEFINRVLLDYCTDRGITFTRSRPYLKNDTCHVEQKNLAVVRRLVGYDRLEWPALPALERIHDLARDYINFLHPVRNWSARRAAVRASPPLRHCSDALSPTAGQRSALDQDDQPTQHSLEAPRPRIVQCVPRQRSGGSGR